MKRTNEVICDKKLKLGNCPNTCKYKTKIKETQYGHINHYCTKEGN